jgi:hypothetical protein
MKSVESDSPRENNFLLHGSRSSLHGSRSSFHGSKGSFAAIKIRDGRIDVRPPPDDADDARIEKIDAPIEPIVDFDASRTSNEPRTLAPQGKTIELDAITR